METFARSLHRVVIADDDPSLRHLVRMMLAPLAHVEIVGEAADGYEAVEQVASAGAHTVLLDVAMPRLDGFAAAEVLCSLRPATRILLHTGEPDDEKRRRAERLGLPLLDKLQLRATVELLGRAAPRPTGAFAIDELVLTALSERRADAVIVVRADGSVPFYSEAASRLLELPFPARPLSIDDLRMLRAGAGGDGDPASPRPYERALAARVVVTDTVHRLGRDGAVHRYTLTSVPLLGADGELRGVANYLTPPLPVA